MFDAVQPGEKWVYIGSVKAWVQPGDVGIAATLQPLNPFEAHLMVDGQMIVCRRADIVRLRMRCENA
jgi:hypothetical protein